MGKRWMFALLITLAACSGCGEEPADPKPVDTTPPKPQVNVPAFNADSAYAYVAKQVSFGPRNPNSEGHTACAEWMASFLGEYADNVIVQRDVVQAYDGLNINMQNVIAQFQPEKKKRLLLMAHWDTRPFADKDNNEDRQQEPILGANDGGSGVGVLLEVARHLHDQPTDYGIDIVLFDAEDYGTPSFPGVESDVYSWCLGSQYWSQHPHVAGYRAKYGILLDMVGAKGAKFPKEGTSMQFAPHVMNKIHKAARSTGNGSFFTSNTTGTTIDDHTFVNQLIGIPSACIVEFYSGINAMGLSGYGDYHHTHNDNMDVISAETLGAVGETLMYVIYNE